MALSSAYFLIFVVSLSVAKRRRGFALISDKPISELKMSPPPSSSYSFTAKLFLTVAALASLASIAGGLSC
jgi:hypothetical protein